MLGALGASAVAAVVLAAAPAAADGYTVDATGRFAPPAAFVPSAAVTYDQSSVPAAASVRVRQQTGPGGATTVRLWVTGVRPGHAYGAAVHQHPCGATAADAGPRYRDRPDGASSPGNEVRLDFTTGPKGTGTATATHSWGFRRGEAASVVIQERPGTNATRVACFTVPFGWVTGMA